MPNQSTESNHDVLNAAEADSARVRTASRSSAADIDAILATYTPAVLLKLGEMASQGHLPSMKLFLEEARARTQKQAGNTPEQRHPKDIYFDNPAITQSDPAFEQLMAELEKKIGFKSVVTNKDKLQ
jgi:hypothetical protein